MWMSPFLHAFLGILTLGLPRVFFLEFEVKQY